MKTGWCYLYPGDIWECVLGEDNGYRTVEKREFSELPPWLQRKLAVLTIAPERQVVRGFGMNRGKGIHCRVFEVLLEDGCDENSMDV